MRKPELLAPAGDKTSFYAAINNGADAIYLGLPAFNARIKAENFTLENLGEYVKTAHLFGVKIYITVNTLISDAEMEEFIKTVSMCLSFGVDAFIIQDFGMAKTLKTLFPDIVLHASTQMGIHNLHGAKALEEIGFSRVVLSRETKFEDIKEIKNGTNLEIEYFVQGALCVCFSGNCYMSALKTGASGNRGLCKQLCRLPYYENGKKGHYLSPNDLCLIASLEELNTAGVSSYKIEGRLKRASYVAQAVKAFRTAIDKNDPNKTEKLKSDIKEVFSRGEFNESAYLYDNYNIIDVKNNNHTGKKIGKIIAKVRFKDIYKYTIKSSEEIAQGDGIKTFGKLENSFGVGNVEVNGDEYTVYTKNNKIEVGDTVHKILDAKKEQALLDKKKSIPLSVEIIAKLNNPVKIKLSGGGETVEKESGLCEKAKNAPITETDLKNRMKFGDTNFEMVDFHATVDNVFIPNSFLNDIRRIATQELENKILEKNKSSFLKNNPNFLGVNESDIKAVLSKNHTHYEYLFSSAVIIDETIDLSMPLTTKTLILSPTSYDSKTIGDFIKQVDEKRKDYTVFLDLPIIATGKEIEKIDAILSEFKTLGVVVNNYYGFKYLKDRITIAGIGLNAYNSQTVKMLKDAGFKGVISSIEKHTQHTYKYSGNPPLMTMAHCPFRVKYGGDCSTCKASNGLTLLDERGNRYVIRRYKIINCYFELLSETALNIGYDENNNDIYSQYVYDLR